jgi:hypothetical protein
VLDYVVKLFFEKGEESVLCILDDLSLLEECCRLSVLESTKDFQYLFDNVNELEVELKCCQQNVDTKKVINQFASPTAKILTSNYNKNLQSYVLGFRKLVIELNQCKVILSSKVLKIVDYFGEESEVCDTSKIFGVLKQFKEALLTSKETFEWRINHQPSN